MKQQNGRCKFHHIRNYVTWNGCCPWGQYQQASGEDAEKKAPAYTAGGNADGAGGGWGRGWQCGGSSNSYGQSCLMTQHSVFCVSTPKLWKRLCVKIQAPLGSVLQRCSRWLGQGDNWRAPAAEDWLKKAWWCILAKECRQVRRAPV